MLVYYDINIFAKFLHTSFLIECYHEPVIYLIILFHFI